MTKAPAKSAAPRKSAARPAPRKSAKVAPPGMQVLSPHIVCRDAAKAIEFYKQAFGAEEVFRLPGPDGKLMHARILVSGSSVFLMDESKEWGALSPKALKGTPVTIHLYVADVDAAFDRAVKAGATVKMAPADQFWGDRYAVIEDPFGHSWSLATTIRDMTEAELQDAARKAMGG